MRFNVPPEAVTASRMLSRETQRGYHCVATDLMSSFSRPRTPSHNPTKIDNAGKACKEGARTDAHTAGAAMEADLLRLRKAGATMEADLLRLRKRIKPKKLAHNGKDISKAQRVAQGSKDESKHNEKIAKESSTERGGTRIGSEDIRRPRMSLPGTGKVKVAKESSEGRGGVGSEDNRRPRISLPITGKELWARARRSLASSKGWRNREKWLLEWVGEEPRFMTMKTKGCISRELDVKLTSEARENRISVTGFGSSMTTTRRETTRASRRRSIS